MSCTVCLGTIWMVSFDTTGDETPACATWFADAADEGAVNAGFADATSLIDATVCGMVSLIAAVFCVSPISALFASLAGWTRPVAAVIDAGTT
jgi:hypothetical protein